MGNTLYNKYKSISTINPAIVENTECLIVKVRAPVISQKEDVLLNHGVSRFVSSYFGLAKNTKEGTAPIQVSY